MMMSNDNGHVRLPDLRGLLPDALAGTLTELGAPSYRARQVFAWLHRRGATNFDAMTDQPAEFRRLLAEHAAFTTLRAVECHAAPDGTAKYLFALADGETIETVSIPDGGRVTVCVSTQVGCAFGCVFCATGARGFTRQLTAAEIVDQVYRVQAALPDGARVTNVVFMGMGEPLANFEELLLALRLLTHPLGLDLAQRRLTVSTVGLPPGIERLADAGLQVNLAISLHAPTQAGRLKLLPIARKYDLEAVMAAARYYLRRTGRKVSFEYTVVPGSNDTPADADALAALVRGMQAMVNVIPLNPTEGMPPGMQHTRAELIARAQAFTELLRARRVEVALRRSRGSEVAGACGQLKGKRK
jgi:23S rRNA (adenine2503-C2)-methyltransferase